MENILGIIPLCHQEFLQCFEWNHCWRSIDFSYHHPISLVQLNHGGDVGLQPTNIQ